MQTLKLPLLKRLIIYTLAGFLAFYHTVTLYDLYVGTGTSASTIFEYIQSALRGCIILSLLFVIFGHRWALWWMWAGIIGLIITQYWAHFGNLPVEFTEGRHPLSYLKGVIIPTVISLVFYSTRKQ